MGFYTTEICFFTGIEVNSCNESDGNCLDGYYYTILFNGKIKEIRLIENYKWKDDVWMKENGKAFIKLLDENNRWDIFSLARDIREIKQLYSELKS